MTEKVPSFNKVKIVCGGGMGREGGGIIREGLCPRQ